MELILLASLALGAVWLTRRQAQRRRIALLGAHLANYQIEKHLETLTQGYQRALDEPDPARRGQIWQLLRPTEQALARQVGRLATDFAAVDAGASRVSKLPLDLPLAQQLLPVAGFFDMRAALALHARAIERAVGDEQASDKARAFRVSAEIFLMQHTCHWFCRSRTVASARLLARHHTSYPQVVAAVQPATRAAYQALTG